NNQNEVLVHDVFHFAAQARPADDLLYQFFSSGAEGFTEEAMLTHIFQGYTATASNYWTTN
ncbi:phage tail protein, partial [Lactobacillus jensenii]|uniref:phage tail protein n=1 Tax=Lactobacillus jensenii TaxID=109790 RepID=UPI002870ACF2